jgi:outer membrane cobalamin receptor
VQIISGAQIANGGFYDVSTALQTLVPGLYVAPRAGAFDYVAASLQGSRTNEILWLLDGQSISNRLYNSITPLDTLPAHMVERIEVIEGGQGLFYGTQAVAGVVNIITKAFSETRDGQIQGGFDTNRGGHLNGFARASRNGHRFVFFGSTDNATGYRPFSDAELTPSTTDVRRGYDVLTLGAKYAYDFSRQLRLSALYQRSDVTLDNIRAGRTSRTQSGGLAAAYNDRTAYLASTKLDFTPRPTTEFFFKAYYNVWDSAWTERHNVIGQPGAVRVIADGDFWGFKDYGGNVLAKLTPTRGFEYFAGYDFQNYSGQDDVLFIDKKTETVHALFGQVRTTRELMPRATLALGGRYAAPSHAESAAIWNASGQYDITSSLFAKTSVGTAFRYPDAYELFANDPTCCFGNPNLEPEKSNTLNASIGMRGRAGAAALLGEAIVFHRTISNLIADVDDGSGEGTTVTANQPDRVKASGVSLVGSMTGAAVTASLGYTYSRTQQQNEVSGGYAAIAGIPSNQVEAMLDLHPVRMPIGATLTVNGVGEMFDSVSGFGNVPSGDYVVTAISGRVFLDRQRRHRINLKVDNLFDREYATFFRRVFTDEAVGQPYLSHYLGTPRTFSMSYSLGF